MAEVHVATGEGMEMALAGALLVYRGGSSAFVTNHVAVKGADGCPELTMGIPATRDSIAELLAGLEMGVSYAGLVPERLLAIAPSMMAWWCPPSPRTVWFECAEDAGKDLGSASGRTSHPGLVFAVAGSRWHVFAVKGTGRPSGDSRLYRAPYFNVWADRGEVCIGNVRVPRSCSPEAMEAYERAFFESRFTHPNPGFRVAFKGGGYALWLQLLAERGRSPFPQRALYPTPYTLAQLVRRLINKEHQ